jgi:hypothetical protein
MTPNMAKTQFLSYENVSFPGRKRKRFRFLRFADVCKLTAEVGRKTSDCYSHVTQIAALDAMNESL